MIETVQVVCPHCDATNRLPADKDARAAKCGRCKSPLFTGHPVVLNHLAVLEQEQGRDAAHAKLLGQGRFGVDVDLDEAGPGLQRLRRLVEHRRHGLAGTAPRGPEIDDQGQAARGQVLAEA